jgi:hypothetical protein
LLLLAGCSQQPPVIVSGTVSYKGQPVSTGQISIIAEDGKSRSDLITAEGNYQVRDAPLGQVTFTITATKLVSEPAKEVATPTGKSDGMTLPPQIVEVSLVPLKYNERQTSDLKRTIAPGQQTINLELTD